MGVDLLGHSILQMYGRQTHRIRYANDYANDHGYTGDYANDSESDRQYEEV